MNETEQPAVKEEDDAHPIASAWTPTFRAIASAFVQGDYGLARRVDGVDSVSAETAKQVSEYIADYDEMLVELSDETWESSVAQWIEPHWDVLVDLRTEGEGQSDLVLNSKVFEAGDGLRVELGMVHVP